MFFSSNFSVEINECKENRTLCGQNAWCLNTIGNYSCSCKTGFRSSSGQEIFMDGQSSCAEIDECKENRTLCGQNAWCLNTIGNYSCSCKTGFRSSSGQEIFMDGQSSCADFDECAQNPWLCGPNAQCTNTVGSYTCSCNPGLFPNTGLEWTLNQTRCEDLTKIQDGKTCNINTGTSSNLTSSSAWFCFITNFNSANIISGYQLQVSTLILWFL
ncbi:adhesion G protein-coupled receptor E1-like [Polyodon spathula]|uniref:adhesion G protein-coupled receptor E1-like n=1 Tax=Polyodon spathula TaxID=7913 RepID=UPI001B7DDE31|nr:adhesion G protein-coupled receptor E1-like [Polyodon spathula]